MSKYFVEGLRETEEEGIFPVDDEEAEFWTVYRRDHDGFGMAMFDLCIKEEAEKLVQVLEERDALLASQNAKQDTPIMYAIIDPYGKPYMSEFCVSPNADDLEGEVEGLNHDLAWEDSEGGRYVVAPLYLAPPAHVASHGWIACSERMPDDEQECLVQTHSGFRYVSFYDEHTGLFYDMPGGNQMDCIEHIFVTHWMPLPAAPQPE